MSLFLNESNVKKSELVFGFVTCTVISISSVSSASFSGYVFGAVIGDAVVVNPPCQLGSDATQTGLLSYYAWVSAENMVTIMLTNPSARSATTNPSVRTQWSVIVIKPKEM